MKKVICYLLVSILLVFLFLVGCVKEKIVIKLKDEKKVL